MNKITNVRILKGFFAIAFDVNGHTHMFRQSIDDIGWYHFLPPNWNMLTIDRELFKTYASMYDIDTTFDELMAMAGKVRRRDMRIRSILPSEQIKFWGLVYGLKMWFVWWRSEFKAILLNRRRHGRDNQNKSWQQVWR